MATATVRRPLCTGDRVTWQYSSRSGGGPLVGVAAVVEQVGPVLVQVRVAARDFFHDTWCQQLHWVFPTSLSLRSLSVPVVDFPSSFPSAYVE